MSVATATEVPDDMLYEVVDGQITEKTVGVREAEIATMLIGFLGPFVRERRLGKIFAMTIFRIDVHKDLQRRPDVAFVSHTKWPFNRRVPDVPVWDMVPDLAVEVLGPIDLAVRSPRKIDEYFKAGVSRVWVIYPEPRDNPHLRLADTDSDRSNSATNWTAATCSPASGCR